MTLKGHNSSWEQAWFTEWVNGRRRNVRSTWSYYSISQLTERKSSCSGDVCAKENVLHKRHIINVTCKVQGEKKQQLWLFNFLISDFVTLNATTLFHSRTNSLLFSLPVIDDWQILRKCEQNLQSKNTGQDNSSASKVKCNCKKFQVTKAETYIFDADLRF